MEKPFYRYNHIAIITSLQSFWEIENSEKHLVYIPEDLTTSYEVFESKEPLVSVHKLFMKAHIPFFYNPPEDVAQAMPEILLRKTAAHKLLKAAKKLPKGIIFSISEGYRPLWYQKQIFQEITLEMKKRHPSFTSEELWEEATKYVADPTLCPPHTTGGAVDITICYEHGEMLDMGAKLNASDENVHTFCEGLAKKQTQNRQLLFDTLTSVGFVNLPTEWWHYSYGDQYWAIYNHQPNAIYDKLNIQKEGGF